MNSKHRVQATIARRPADRVPLGFYVVDHDTIERVIGRKTYVRNKIAIQVALWEGRREEVAESLKRDIVEFYRKIDCADILLPKEAMLLPPRGYEPERARRISEDRWERKDGRIFRAMQDANEMACIHDPRPKTFTIEQFQKPVKLSPPDPSVFEVIDHVMAALGEERYVASPSGGMVAMTMLGGTEEGALRYLTEPELVLAASRRKVAEQNAMDEFYIRDSPGVLIEQDMAGSNAPLLSPGMFREMCLPFLKERVAHIKQYAPQVILHNCGNNIPLMDQFVEAGIDCYQSLQTTAGMEIGRLKKDFGDRLCFWGGVPVELLIAGEPGQVRKAARGAMERGAPGGGFILGPSHSIAKNTRYDNFMAMLDEFVKLRDKF